MIGFKRHWAIGAAFSFLSVTQQSSTSATYNYSLVDPRAQEYQREYAETDGVDPLVLKAREYLTQAVLRYERPLWSRVSLGASVGAGWLVADNHLEYARATEGGFYPIRRSSAWSMTGNGQAPAVDAWLTARVAVTKRVGLLLEGGYAWHQVRTVNGSGAFEGITQDGEAAEVELSRTYRVTGRWVNQSTTFQSGGTRWQGTIPAIGVDGSAYTLSLSGWRVNLGLSVGL